MEIRTPVLTLKGLRPGPLDDGGLHSTYRFDSSERSGIWRFETAYTKAGGLYHSLEHWSSNWL